MPNLLTDAPLFHVYMSSKLISKQYDKFRAFTDVATLADDPDFPNNLRVIQTVCSETNSYFLMSNGQVHAVGANDRWQCSELENVEGMQMIDDEILKPILESKKPNPLIPPEAAKIILEVQKRQAIKIPHVVHIGGKNAKHEEQIKHISVGAHHVLATSTSGLVFAWGNNEHGQLGLGKETAIINKAQLVGELADKKIKMTAAGTNHSLFLAELGQIYTSGFNEFG